VNSPAIDFIPRKHLGQNFLIDDVLAAKMVDRITVNAGEDVLEVGPGFGALTGHLLAKGIPVFAVEYDPRLCAYLEQYYRNNDKFKVTYADILAFNVDALPSMRPLVLVSNLPYTISHDFLYWMLARRHRFVRAYVTLQKEVALRLAAVPDTREYGPLSIACGCFYQVRRIMQLSPRVFSPQPGVESAFMHLEGRPQGVARIADWEVFLRLVRAAFAQRRKMLKNNLLGAGHLPLSGAALVELAGRCGIDPARRAETVTREEFITLTNAVCGAVHA
jgi:16S rRNA (adenine1518-N6/adenine1519-N6)-dimethyltransferase